METEQKVCSVSYFNDQYSGRITLETGPIRRQNHHKGDFLPVRSVRSKRYLFSIQIGYQHFMYSSTDQVIILFRTQHTRSVI